MGLFSVNSINNSQQHCTVNWSYKGELPIIPKPIYVSPGFVDREDAANFALSFIYPAASFYGDDILLPYSVSQYSAKFWESKIKSIGVFFKQLLPVKIFPVEDLPLLSYSGVECGLFWGGGIDACSALITLIERGERPTLIRLHRPDNKPGGKFYQSAKHISQQFGVPLVVIKQNIIEYSHQQLVVPKVVNQFLNRNSSLFLFNHYYLSSNPKFWDQLLTYFVWQGFQLFFSSLGVSATRIKQLYLASDSHATTESYCLGFNLLDKIGYRGISFDALITGDKAEQYDLLFRKHPEIVPWIKSCNKDDKQWCGCCYKCRRASIWRGIFENVSETIDEDIYIGEEELTEMFSMLSYYRKQKNRSMEIELQILTTIRAALDRLARTKGVKS